MPTNADVDARTRFVNHKSRTALLNIKNPTGDILIESFLKSGQNRGLLVCPSYNLRYMLEQLLGAVDQLTAAGVSAKVRFSEASARLLLPDDPCLIVRSADSNFSIAPGLPAQWVGVHNFDGLQPRDRRCFTYFAQHPPATTVMIRVTASIKDLTPGVWSYEATIL